MTRTRPTQYGGRGGGHGAVVPPASRASRSPKRLIAGGLAAVTVTGAAVTFGGIAQAENPPLGPGNIEIFAKRDMVALEGYTAQAGENATVTVSRGGDRKSTRLNSSHANISYAVFCLKKKIYYAILIP